MLALAIALIAGLWMLDFAAEERGAERGWDEGYDAAIVRVRECNLAFAASSVQGPCEEMP